MFPALMRKESEFWLRQLDATSAAEQKALPPAFSWSDLERDEIRVEPAADENRFTIWDV